MVNLSNERKDRMIANKNFKDENDFQNHMNFIKDEDKKLDFENRTCEVRNWLDIIKLDSLYEEFRVLDVRGHTNSHIAYYFDKKLFCGDTLFSCGCGRLFEGTHNDMHRALTKINNLPKETMIYCAHEYTLDNIGFAKILDPENLELLNREREVKSILKKGEYTVPSLLANELKINPFLRFDNKNIINSVQKHFNIKISNEAEIFKYTREWKDNEYD